MNPFILPERPVDDSRPLCPWLIPEHSDYYAEVDNSLVAFTEFKQLVASDSSFSRSGRLVLVTGPEGCGKTALIHRCASHLLNTLADTTGVRPLVFDLTTQGQSGADIQTRVQHACHRILDELELSGRLTQPEIDALHKRRESPDTAFPFVSRILANNNITIIVLLPPTELVEEITKYSTLTNENLVLFCESSYQPVERFAESIRNGSSSLNVTCLSVGVLNVDDGWRFVESRLSQAARAGIALPAISMDTIQRLMEIRIGSAGRTSVRELHMTCLRVFQKAIESSAPSVEYLDFLEYYTRRAI